MENVDGKSFKTSDGQFVHKTYVMRMNVDGYYIQTIYGQAVKTNGGRLIETMYVMTKYISFRPGIPCSPFSDVTSMNVELTTVHFNISN